MATAEDSAAVLEQFMQDAANLPAEIAHMMEEIQVKERDMQKYQTSINARDGALQKHLQLNGSLNAHPKEKDYSDIIMKSYSQCQELQDQKIALSDKACTLLDRQLRTLDVKIRELQKDGQLLDDPVIPSVFNRSSAYPDSGRSLIAPSQPLQTTSGNAVPASLRASLSANRPSSLNHQSPAPAFSMASRLSQLSAGGTGNHQPRNSAPATPASSAQQLQHQGLSRRYRESSAGANEHKKRRLNLCLPAQSSSLRQSSLGPVTSKAGTPTTGASRAGSAAPTSASGQHATGTKKSFKLSKITPHHQQISKLKGKPLKQPRAAQRKGQSPSVRSRSKASGRDDDGSIISSADDTDGSTATSRSRRAARSTPTSIIINQHSYHRSKLRSDDDVDSKDVGIKGDNDVAVTDAGSSRRSKTEKGRLGTGDNTDERDFKSEQKEREIGEDENGEGEDDIDGEEGEEEDEDVEEEAEDDEEEQEEDDQRYCFCQKVSYGEMVGCENDKCPYEWFHLNCVGLKEAPKDQDIWYCPECRPMFDGRSGNEVGRETNGAMVGAGAGGVGEDPPG